MFKIIFPGCDVRASLMLFLCNYTWEVIFIFFVHLVSGHLIKRFNMTEQDWHRIKQNIDSKCRTAFRRKQRGLPLTVKAFRGKAPTVMNTMLSGYPQVILHVYYITVLLLRCIGDSPNFSCPGPSFWGPIGYLV